MTDNEIKKALELNVALYGKEIYIGWQIKVADVLDLINQYEAEIKSLKESLNIEFENFATEYDNKMKAEAIKEFAEKIFKEIQDAIISNDKAKNERIEKHNVDRYEDDFCIMCDAKIMALGGIRYFIKNLLKEKGVE